MAGSGPSPRAAAAWPLVAVAAGLAVALLLVGLYSPRLPGPADLFPGADKVQHAIGFALPVVLIPLADTLRRRTAGRGPRARVLVVVVWVSVVHAVVSELVQHAAYANRDGDWRDVLADWSGVAVGGLVVGTVLAYWQSGGRRSAVVPSEEPADRG